MARATLLDFFDDIAGIRREYLVYDDGYRIRRYRYDEVGCASRAFAARLQAAGFEKGDPVVIWSENRPEWIVALWGCILAGVIVVPIDYRASGEFLARVRQRVGARLLLVGDEVPLPGDSFGVDIWRLGELDWAATARPSAVSIAAA